MPADLWRMARIPIDQVVRVSKRNDLAIATDGATRLSTLLGHTNLTTTSRYLNIHRRGLQMAMEKLEQHQAEPKAVGQALHNDETGASRCARIERHSHP